MECSQIKDLKALLSTAGLNEDLLHRYHKVCDTSSDFIVSSLDCLSQQEFVDSMMASLEDPLTMSVWLLVYQKTKSVQSHSQQSLHSQQDQLTEWACRGIVTPGTTWQMELSFDIDITNIRIFSDPCQRLRDFDVMILDKNGRTVHTVYFNDEQARARTLYELPRINCIGCIIKIRLRHENYYYIPLKISGIQIYGTQASMIEWPARRALQVHSHLY